MIQSWERELIQQEASALVEHAWAGGNRALQRGYWDYCRGELEKLDKRLPGTLETAMQTLRERREGRAGQD